MTKNKKRCGFTLIEMLCVMAVLVIVTGTLALLIRDTLEAQRIQAESFDRLLQSTTLADQFRADVAQAESAPAHWQKYDAGPATLILKMKDQSHVVYIWRQGKLDRLHVEKDTENKRNLPVGSQVGLAFAREGPDAKLLRLRLFTLRDGKARPGQALEIAAALGGYLAMKRSIKRKGVAIIMALIAMAIVTIVMTVLVAQIVAQRRLVHQRERQLQAEWLARAGVELAAARLLETPTAFTDAKTVLLPDTTLKVAVEKTGKNGFAVTVEARVGAQDVAAVVREANARFRRTEKDGVVRLVAVGLEKK